MFCGKYFLQHTILLWKCVCGIAQSKSGAFYCLQMDSTCMAFESTESSGRPVTTVSSVR